MLSGIVCDRYLIDFYDGQTSLRGSSRHRTPEEIEKVAIHIDARPDLLSKSGIRDRVKMYFIKKGILDP